MLLEFAEWWVNQMRSLLPAALSPAAMAADARIISINRMQAAEGAAPDGTVLLRRKGLETAIAALDAGQPALVTGANLATGLRLPREAMLCREVTLPLAAARNIETVITFEMDRLTPFRADELFWGISGVKADRTHGRLSLQLFFVLREQLDTLLPALRRIGLSPSFIEAGSGRIELTTEHREARGPTQPILMGLCGVLALACVTAPILRQQMALDAAQQSIAAIAPAAQIAQHLRRQLDIAASGQRAVADALHAGNALQVLAGLTDALPDDTWLSDLSLKSGTVSFDGRSAHAAALIGSLSAVPGLTNPSFTAPITRTADGSADEFSLQATVH